MIPVFFAIGRSKDILSSSAGSWTQKSDMTCWHNTKVELYKFKTNTTIEKIKIPAIKNVRKQVPTSRISIWSLYQFSYYSGTSMCDHLWYSQITIYRCDHPYATANKDSEFCSFYS